MELVNVICPDCGEGHRIDIEKPPGHCYYCGRLLRVNPETMEVEPGKGEETDVIETQYKKLRKKQKFGKNKSNSENK